MAQKLPHLDAAESAFFLTELRDLSKEMREVKYAQLKGLTHVPAKTDIDPAAEYHEYRVWDYRGSKAKRMTSPDENLPTVNTFGVPFTQRLQSYGNAFHYTVDEIRAAQKAGRPLDRMRAMAARKVLDQNMDDIIFNGDSAANLPGFNSLSGTFTYAPATTGAGGGGSSPLWVNKTADQIIFDLNQMISVVRVGTKEVESPTRILLPTAHMELISNTPRSSISDTTIKKFFEGTHPAVSIDSWERLTGAGASGKDRIVAYDPTQENLQFLVAIPFEQLAPQMVGFSYKINCRMKVGGTICPFPKSVLIADGA